MPSQEELILTKNYANDPKIAGRALDHVTSIWQNVVANRQPLEERWYQYFNIWNTIFDIQYYNGRSQVYSPQLRKNVEFAVRNLRRNLFPTDDYFGVEPADDDERLDSEKVKQFLQWQQTNKTRLKRYVTPFLRQLVLYGWSPVKVVWQQEDKDVFTHERQAIPIMGKVANPLTGKKEPVQIGEEEAIVQVKKKLRMKNHPSFLPIDIFSFYIYPMTIWDIEDAYATIEEIPTAKHTLQLKEDNGEYTNVDKLLSAEPTWDSTKRSYSAKRRLMKLGLPESPIKEIPEWNIQEYWGKFDLFDNGKEIDCNIVIGEERIVLAVRQNPYYDQEPPYILAKLDEMVGEVYAHGLVEPLQTLQYHLNDTKNQIHDSLSYILNPITKYDPMQVVNPNTLVFAPGALWALSDPGAAVFDRPPDLAQSGWESINSLMNEIDEYPGFEKVPTTGRRAATQVTAIQEDRGVSILDWSENIEAEAMNPFLRKSFGLNQQFLDEEIFFKVTGKPMSRMSPEDLVGNYHFFWLGANQTQNQVIRSRQMIDAIGVAAQIPPQPDKRLDLMYMFERFWKDGLGLDGYDKLVQEIDLTNMMDPEKENEILAMGKQLPINMMDDDQAHIQTHAQLLQYDLPEFNKDVVKTHIGGHMEKMMQMQASQRGATPPSAQIASEQQNTSPGNPVNGGQ